MRFRKAGLGVEVRWRHEKYALDAGERLRQSVGISDRRDCDLASLLCPRPALVSVADDGPDRQAGGEQSACNDASDLPGDSRHRVHDLSPSTRLSDRPSESDL